MVPGSAPQPTDRGILLISVFGETIQRGLGRCQGRSLIDPRRSLTTVLPEDIGQTVTHHADDALLHLGPEVYRFYGLRKAGEAAAAGDENTADPEDFQFGQDVEPGFRVFLQLTSQPQES